MRGFPHSCRNAEGESSAFALLAPYVKVPSQYPGALLHARQTHAFLGSRLLGAMFYVKSLPVILNEEQNPVAVSLEFYQDGPGLGVVGYVCQSLLENSEYHNLIILGKKLIQVFYGGFGLNLVMLDKTVDQPSKGGRQPHILEDGGAQVPGKPVHVVDDLIDVLQSLPAFFPQRRLVALQVLFNKSGPEFHDRQRPPEFIVQLSGNAPALGFLSG